MIITEELPKEKKQRVRRKSHRRRRNIREYDEELVQDKPLAAYIREIDQIPLLSREEEQDLAKRMADGEEWAREKLINANLRFVVKIAKKYKNDTVPLIDLINEGNAGLIQATRKFDYKKGYHFISYAVWWIKQAILKAILEQSGPMRLPMNRLNQLLRIRRYISESEKQNGSYEVTTEDIAEHLDIKESDLKNIMVASKDHVSLESAILTDKKEVYLKDILLDDTYGRPDDTIVSVALREDINGILKTLSEKEETVIKYRFGLDGYEALSLSQIGKKMHLTKERIRQIEKNALKRLRHFTRSKRLREYVAQ